MHCQFLTSLADTDTIKFCDILTVNHIKAIHVANAEGFFFINTSVFCTLDFCIKITV